MKRLVLVASAAAIFAGAPANAATAFLGFTIVGQAFERVGAPTAEVIPTQNGVYFRELVDTSSDFTLTGVAPAYTAGLTLPTYNVRYTAATDTIIIFGAADGEALSTAQSDFYAVITNVTGAKPLASSLAFSTASSPGGFWNAGVVNAGIPEPATWAMMIGGFGFIGAATRQRRRVAFS